MGPRWLVLTVLCGLVLLLLSRHAAAQSALESFNPGTNGTVRSTVVQADGKIIVGGTFTTVAGQARNNLARLNADGSLDTNFNPDVNSNVFSLLLLADGTIVIGGDFTTVGGAARTYIARLNADGTDTGFNPAANNRVSTLALNGSAIVVGGSFTTIGGQTRNRIASLDSSTALATSWNPNANNAVLSVAVSGSSVYVGGNFTAIGGQSRNRIASLDASTGLATAWNPNANSSVNSIALSGSQVYVGGVFTTIGGQSRNRIARLDNSTGLADTWNPSPSNTVNQIAVSGSAVYAGGTFTSIGGQARRAFAQLDAGTGLPSAFDAALNTGANLSSVTVQPDGKVLVGGTFTSVGADSRASIARFSVPDTPTALTANTGNTMVALAWIGSATPDYTVNVVPNVSGSNVACTTQGVTNCQVTGLANGTTYTFTVTATNALGTSAASAPVSATPQAQLLAQLPLPGAAGNAQVAISGAPAGCLLVPGSAQFSSTALTGAPAGAVFPVGVFSFEATGCPNATLTVNITYPSALAAGVQLQKYGPQVFMGPNGLFTPTGASISGDRLTASYQVVDNGEGDSNATLGAIRDPFAPMLAPASAESIPTLSEWGLLLLSGLMALAALAMHARRRA